MTNRGMGLVGNAARASVAGISTLLLAALLVVAGRLLGDQEYGKFSFALALAMIFETVMDFGLKEITTQKVARDRRAARSLVAQTFGLKLALAPLPRSAWWWPRTCCVRNRMSGWHAICLEPRRYSDPTC